MNNFWQRTITGVVFVAVMMAAIYFGYTFWLFLVICFFGLREFYTLMYGQKQNLTAKIYGVVGGMVVYTLLGVILTRGMFYSELRHFGGRPDSLSVLLPLFLIVALIELFRKHPDAIKNLSVTLLGWIYVAVPFAIGFVLDFEANGGNTFYQNVPSQIPFLICIFLLIWTNDVFAYLTGRLIGRTPLFTRISPKKTIEGTLGGAILTMVVAWLLQNQLPYDYKHSMAATLALGIVVAVMGILGDLIESKFKRQLNIKDSGNILPGHGGILDRFDSFIYIVPWVYLLGNIVGNLPINALIK